MKICLYNFREAAGGTLRYDWSTATSLLTAKSLPYPPYFQEEWSPFWKSSSTYTVELDCRKGREIIYNVVYRMTEFGAAICEEFLNAGPSNVAAQPEVLVSEVASAAQVPESDFNAANRPRPALYQTLSDTPFYWKTR